MELMKTTVFVFLIYYATAKPSSSCCKKFDTYYECDICRTIVFRDVWNITVKLLSPRTTKICAVTGSVSLVYAKTNWQFEHLCGHTCAIKQVEKGTEKRGCEPIITTTHATSSATNTSGSTPAMTISDIITSKSFTSSTTHTRGSTPATSVTTFSDVPTTSKSFTSTRTDIISATTTSGTPPISVNTSYSNSTVTPPTTAMTTMQPTSTTNLNYLFTLIAVPLANILFLAVYVMHKLRKSTANCDGITAPPVTVTENTPLVAQAAFPNPTFQAFDDNFLEMSIMSNASSDSPIASRTRSRSMQSARSCDF